MNNVGKFVIIISFINLSLYPSVSIIFHCLYDFWCSWYTLFYIFSYCNYYPSLFFLFLYSQRWWNSSIIYIIVCIFVCLIFDLDLLTLSLLGQMFIEGLKCSTLIFDVYFWFTLSTKSSHSTNVVPNVVLGDPVKGLTMDNVWVVVIIIVLVRIG